MPELDQVETELAAIGEQVRPLMKRQAELERERRRLRSVAFMEAHQVKPEDVEMSSGDDKPYFGSVDEFARWMEKNKVRKRFYEWNERIYFTAEIIAGRFDADASTTIQELPTE